MDDRLERIVTAIELPEYFERIGYAVEPVPTLDTLRTLHLRHTQAIAFENLNPLLDRPVPLDAESLVRKLVHERRGGYCFEQNLLFMRVLDAIGFRVTGLAARVMWNAAEDAVTKRSHMVLRIDLDDGVYIADVGFGGQTLTGPLRLVPDTEQATPHEPFRLVQSGGDFVQQSLIEGAWRSLYRFDLQRQHPIDYEAPNWFVSTHPGSIFRTTLRAARPFEGGRYALLNNQLAVHRLGKATERHALTSVAEIREALEELFLLHLPGVDELDAALARFL
jgi:N-hydroxyarylamine O-acetyltransferase